MRSRLVEKLSAAPHGSQKCCAACSTEAGSVRSAALVARLCDGQPTRMWLELAEELERKPAPIVQDGDAQIKRH